MTVLAWDSKILAADKMALQGDTQKRVTKIFKLASGGQVVGFTGDLDLGLVLLEWYQSGADRKAFPKQRDEKEAWGVLVVAGRDGCFFYERYGVAIPVEDHFMAWGAGREAAIGAMEMGANAIQAVAVASKWVSGCGHGCDWFAINQ